MPYSAYKYDWVLRISCTHGIDCIDLYNLERQKTCG